ncbi:MAG: hypothetical protein U5S82_24025 [Gammaproteobacteria bacterium]|nr:hypothetical protein [Gammaproteobacteria bacterium]
MTIPEAVKRELLAAAASADLRRDMALVRAGRAARTLTPDEYVRFVTEYNAFIDHQLKPFRPMVDDDMRL